MTNRLPPFSAAALLQTLTSLPGANSYIVGFSGGADSTALLYALTRLKPRLETPVSAVHINHGIHKDADVWQQHCESFCRQHSIPLQCLKVNPVNRNGNGLEAEARQLRYDAITDLLKPGDCLLTAHHSDDQAETLLLNLMRGSGVDGLSAMPEHRPLGAGSLQRPLLGFQNSMLRDYLADKGIDWLEDPSNLLLNHDRNYVRHEVIPLLEKRWPGINKRLLLTRMAMAESRSLLEPIADEYLQQHLAHRFVLLITEQLEQNPALIKLVIRRWLKKTVVPSVPAHRLNSLCRQLQQAKKAQKITILWAGWSLRVYKRQLWLQPDNEIPPCPSLEWPIGQSDVDLGGDIGKLTINGQNPNSLPGQLRIGSRQHNKGISLKQGAHHKSLKNLFQSTGVPSWLRDNIPLCIMDGELVAVGDWIFSEPFAAWMSENRVAYSWQPQNPLLQIVAAQQHSNLVARGG